MKYLVFISIRYTHKISSCLGAVLALLLRQGLVLALFGPAQILFKNAFRFCQATRII
jgi:hypothetical protein